MNSVLGIAVGQSEVRALVRRAGVIAWAGRAPADGPGELAEAIAQLAAEAEGRPRRCRVVLERDAVQLRLIEPAPPLRGKALRSSIALQAARWFRTRDAGLVTDAMRLRGAGRHWVVFAAAADAAVVAAVTAGCEQAGLRLSSIGPAADVLPLALATPPAGGQLALPAGSAGQCIHLLAGRGIRSTRTAVAPPDLKWRQPLASLGSDAAAFAPAFSATLAAPRLVLLPAAAVARRRRATLARIRRLAVSATLAWLGSGAASTLRTARAEREASAALTALRPALERVLAVQRDLDAAASAVETIHRAEAGRSRHLGLLAALTTGLSDSVALVSLRLERDSTLHLAGYAPIADAVVAVLERTPGMRDPRMEAPASRQAFASAGRPPRELDRFALTARLERYP